MDALALFPARHALLEPAFDEHLPELVLRQRLQVRDQRRGRRGLPGWRHGSDRSRRGAPHPETFHHAGGDLRSLDDGTVGLCVPRLRLRLLCRRGTNRRARRRAMREARGRRGGGGASSADLVLLEDEEDARDRPVVDAVRRVPPRAAAHARNDAKRRDGIIGRRRDAPPDRRGVDGSTISCRRARTPSASRRGWCTGPVPCSRRRRRGRPGPSRGPRPCRCRPSRRCPSTRRRTACPCACT